MNSLLDKLVDLLLSAVQEELKKRYPELPIEKLLDLAIEYGEILVRFARDDVQREAEIRALYARAEHDLYKLLKGGGEV